MQGTGTINQSATSAIRDQKYVTHRQIIERHTGRRAVGVNLRRVYTDDAIVLHLRHGGPLYTAAALRISFSSVSTDIINQHSTRCCSTSTDLTRSLFKCIRVMKSF